MGRVLRTAVHVTDENSTVTVLAAGDVVPKELAKYVSNPKAFVPTDEGLETDESAADADEDGPYAGQSIDELKEQLRQRELPVGGNKAELVSRLVEDDENTADESAADADEDDL
jgi:hypothetical protein